MPKYLPLSGGRVTGNLYLDQGFNVSSSGDGGGTTGYLLMAEINVKGTFMNAVQIKIDGNRVANIPSGSIKANNYGDTGWVDCSMGDGISANSGTHNRPQVRKMGKVVHSRGIVTNSTTWQTHDSIIIRPSG